MEMTIKSEAYQKSLVAQRLSYAEDMETAFLEATNNELKAEVAVRLAWKIANALDYEDADLMHLTPLRRARMFVPRIKDEAFINGKNNYK